MIRPDRERMRITAQVMEQIGATIGHREPECGGVLGMDEHGVISAYYFDQSGTGGENSYVPDVESINRVLAEEWMPRGIYMAGIVHSHSRGLAAPSCMDVGYAARILQALDTVDVFYLPIVTFAEAGLRLSAYAVCCDGDVRCRAVSTEIIE